MEAITLNSLQVGDALRMMEKYLDDACMPLEQLRIVAKEARRIPGITYQVDVSLLKMIGEIDRIIGGSQWEPVGKLRTEIENLRQGLPFHEKQTGENVNSVSRGTG